MAYRVLLTEETERFLHGLNEKMRAKAIRSLELLRRFGYQLPMPHARRLKGYPLSEIRVKQGSDIVRLFYFSHGDAVYVVTSGYVKKSDKTSRTEIERAMKIRSVFLKEAER